MLPSKTQNDSKLSDFFLPYQRQWIEQKSRFSIYVKARQIGITLAEAFWSFLRRLTVRMDHFFCSKKEDTSKEFIRYVKQFAEAANIALGYEVLTKDSLQMECVVFPNGARIVAMTSSPSSFRGPKGDVTWDEAAFHDHAEEFYIAAKPMTTWGGHFHIISTENGVGTTFHQLLQDAQTNKNDFKVFRTTLQDAVDAGLSEKVPGDHQSIECPAERHKAYIEHVRRGCLSEAMFRQEFCCEALGASTIITPEQYDKCIIPNFPIAREQYLTDLSKCGPIYIGIDVGATKDKTVVHAFEQGEDAKETRLSMKRTYRTILTRTISDLTFDAQFEIIASLVSHPKVRKVLIESNGIGLGLAQQLERVFPGKCHGWFTTAQNKSHAIERLAGWVSQNRIGLPGDADVREDILAMRRILSVTGKIAYDGHSSVGHCDHYIAAALALAAAEDELSFFGFSAT